VSASAHLIPEFVEGFLRISPSPEAATGDLPPAAVSPGLKLRPEVPLLTPRLEVTQPSQYDSQAS